MRNLKKVLALVLALAMAFSLVASAASFPDVTVNTPTADAVDLLSGLGIIGGYPDGTFGPEKTITRAEFSKMLFVMINGNDNSGLYEGAANKYSDCKADAWYAPYVNWADQLKIVGGYPDGTFKPDKEITIAEAAKMLVTALGFDANDYSFPYGFIDKASTIGLFKDVTGVKADDPALRGNVAIMAYNTLFVTTAPRYAEYVNQGQGTINGWVYKTPLEAVFGAKKAVTEITSTSTFMPAVNGIDEEGKAYLKGVAADADLGTTAVVAGEYDLTDVDELVGHKITIWYLEDKNNSNGKLDSAKYDTIISISDNVETTVVATAASMTTASGQVDEMKQGDCYTTIDGVNIPLFLAVRDLNGNPTHTGGDMKLHFWNDGTNDYKNWVLNGGASDPKFRVGPRAFNQNAVPFTQTIAAVYSFIDNDVLENDNNDRSKDSWDHVYVNYWRAGKVTAVTSSTITIEGINNNGAIPAKQIKGGIPSVKKDDIVLVACTSGIVEKEIKDIYTIVAAQTDKNVTLTARTNRGVEIDGSAHSISFFSANGTTAHSNLVAGKKYDVSYDNAGNIVYIVPAEEELPVYMLVKDVAQSVAGFGSTTYTMTGLLSDGTTKTYEVVAGTEGLNGSCKLDVLGNNDLPTTDPGYATRFADDITIFDSTETTGWVNNNGAAINTSDLTSEDASIAAIGKLVKFSVNADGKIVKIEAAVTNPVDGQLFKFDAANSVLYKKATGAASYTMSNLTTANTVFFSYDDNDTAYDYSDDEFKVVTADKMSSFENTVLAAYTTVKDEPLKVEAVLINTDLGEVSGDNTIMAIATYENTFITVDDTHIKVGLKLIANGKCDWYYTNPIDISSAPTDAAGLKRFLFGKVIPGATTNPGMNQYGYIELDGTGALTKFHLSQYSGNVKMDLTQMNVASTTTSTGLNQVNKYRAAVLGVNGNVVTLGAVNYNGTAKEILSNTLSHNTDGTVTVSTSRGYGDARVMFPLASDVQITKCVAQISGMNAFVTTSVGSVADLQTSSDGGYSYAIDFVLRHKDNNAANPLEISQIIVYSAVNNFTETVYASEDDVLPNGRAVVGDVYASQAGQDVTINVGSLVTSTPTVQSCKLNGVAGTVNGFRITVRVPAGATAGQTITGSYTLTNGFTREIPITLTVKADPTVTVAELNSVTAGASVSITTRRGGLIAGVDGLTTGVRLAGSGDDFAASVTTTNGTWAKDGLNLKYTANAGATAGADDEVEVLVNPNNGIIEGARFVIKVKATIA